MSDHFISALFDLQTHFPHLSWEIEGGNLVITAPATDEQIKFLLGGRAMFTPE